MSRCGDRREVSVLHASFRIRIVAQDGAGDAEQPSIVLAHERLEGGMVVAGNSMHELSVFEGGRGAHVYRMPGGGPAFPALGRL